MNHGALIPALILLASCASAATPSPEDAVEFRESQSSVGLDMPLDRSELTPGEMRPAFVCGAEVLGSRKPVAVDADSGKTVPLFSYDKIFLIPEGEARFANPAIAYLHIRSARNNCFQLRITRAADGA